MKKLISVFLIMLALAVPSFAHADAAVKPEADSTSLQAGTTWTNQRGSTLTIDSVGSNGQIAGTYVNRAAGFGCQKTPYPVIGWIYGTAITFTVAWKNPSASCQSITAWTGFYLKGEIQTKWQLVEDGATNPSQIMQGSDTFRRAAGEKETH